MNHSIYMTDDAAVITVLNLHGLHPLSVDTEGRKVWFRFERTALLTEVIDSYDRGALQVSAKMFALLYRDCVTRIRRQAEAR